MKTDKQLLNDFSCNRDHIIFREFYNRYDTLFRTRAFRFLKNREDTEDFLQEFWIRLLNGTEKIRTNEQGSAEGYLIVMLTHDLYDYLRIKGLATESLDDYLLDKLHKMEDFAYNQVEDELYLNEVIAHKDRIVNDLPENDRLIYNLYARHNLSVQEISRACSLSEKTVRNKLSIIKNSIKGQLQLLSSGSYVLPLCVLIHSNII
jgi:RNA polymerase sigma factor (sigma-70 family)